MKNETKKAGPAKSLKGPMATWMKRHNLRTYSAAYGALSMKNLDCTFQCFLNWIEGKHRPSTQHAIVLVESGVVGWDFFLTRKASAPASSSTASAA